ncbi:MAG TPA: prepilin-type N-terminal cleavage/methylation domain-containing protein [Candidatus Limnocylindria bacterium]|nr:prepilin-type N-terminal cleavage/methylation domain-containing protein [Candidatus Limnocylindria bacterium]
MADKKTKDFFNRTYKQGQTLIETLAALFILTMGISAAVGLAVYAFNSSTNITKQVVATGLAREGIEAVKNMRDTNWLAGTLSTPNRGNGCYSYSSASANGANCYRGWLSQIFCINPTTPLIGCDGSAATMSYALGIDSSSPNLWVLLPQHGTTKYGLDFDANNSGTGGFYSPGAFGISCLSGSADYCRKIVITKITSAPYNQDIGPLLQVQSQVWWSDKQCPKTDDWPGLGSCSTELDSYLTNWQSYTK